jgi:hypothetical protein
LPDYLQLVTASLESSAGEFPMELKNNGVTIQ